MSLFGKNIKKIRSVRGLTQSQLADMIEVSRGVVSSYEEGRAEPKIETILKTASVFSVSVDHLLKTALTVNQLSGFSLPEVAKTKALKANNISKLISDFNNLNKNYQFILQKTIHEVEKQWIHYEGYFITQMQPKNNELFVIETAQKSYLGTVQMLNSETLKISNDTIDLKSILFSGMVIGGYSAFGGQNTWEHRLRNVELELEVLRKKIENKD
uniref:helix-turn-helix domain-containing protein n=1 Tax=Flavobacterium sp. TaxID=239 RepID=UPI00404A4A7F